MAPSPAEARFDGLYLSHARAVRAYALRRVPADDADDVVAEVFTTAWRMLDRVPADALPWLLGVARNVILHRRRAAGRRSALDARLRGERPPAAAVPHADLSAVLVALAALGERDREVVLLTCWEGLAPAEVAVVVGGSAAAVRVRLHRARRRLARLMEADAGRVSREETA